MHKAIETENLSKYYGRSVGMQDVTFDIEQGEIFGFIGPNGAGKSTTIRTLLNLLFPSSGKGKILGYDIVKDSRKIKSVTGYLPSEVNYYYKMNVNELLSYSSRFYKNIDNQRIKYLTDALDLDTDKKIRDLSLGNKKKVSIVQSMLHKPKLLILDEPTSGLDPLVQSALFELLKEENKKGTSIFFSSHVLSDVQKICSRVAIIQKGRLIKVENIDTLGQKLLKKVKVEFCQSIPDLNYELLGAVDLVKNGNSLAFLYNHDINQIVREFANYELANLSIEEPSLEEIFMHYYMNAELK